MLHTKHLKPKLRKLDYNLIKSPEDREIKEGSNQIKTQEKGDAFGKIYGTLIPLTNKTNSKIEKTKQERDLVLLNS